MTYNKLEPIEGKRSGWQGLWYQKEWHCFSSAVFNLAQLKKYKGNIRLKVVKNRFYKDGENRPNYVFCIMDANGPKVIDLDVEDIPEEPTERLYTHDEVQYAIDRAVSDARSGYYDNIVSDYL